MTGYVGAALRRLVVQRAGGRCEYCLIHEDDTEVGLQIEHVISEKHGGLTVADNLASSCVYCNRHKGTDIASLTATTGRLTPLFHPRRDVWSQHFQISGPANLGIPEVGEVTARLLRMNDTDRLLERFALQQLGRYRTS